MHHILIMELPSVENQLKVLLTLPFVRAVVGVVRGQPEVAHSHTSRPRDLTYLDR